MLEGGVMTGQQYPCQPKEQQHSLRRKSHPENSLAFQKVLWKEAGGFAEPSLQWWLITSFRSHLASLGSTSL